MQPVILQFLCETCQQTALKQVLQLQTGKNKQLQQCPTYFNELGDTPRVAAGIFKQSCKMKI
jgi:hypothetical protein